MSRRERSRVEVRRGTLDLLLLRTPLRTWPFLEQLSQDTRYALRALRRSPGFAVVAILTLALGIGVNTAIFSVVNAALLRPLPYRDPAALVLIDTSPLRPAPTWLTTAWRDRARTLSDFAGVNGPRAATLVRAGASQQIDAADVTWNFLSLLGVAPIVGRDFTSTDADPAAPPVAIVSHELWRRAFGSDDAIVGKIVTVTGNPVTIVGVAPSGFLFPTAGALSATRMPTDTQPDLLRIANATVPVNVIGRLATASTPAAVSGELLAIFKQEAVTRLRAPAIERAEVDAAPLLDRLVGNARERLWLVMGAVGFVLLVACVNVANLLLARASTRQRELALRMALGAGRARVARLVLAESFLLAIFGAAVGLLFAYLTSGVARTLLADRLPHVDAIPIDARVLAFNIAAGFATAMLCGLVSLPGVRRVSMAAIVDSSAPAVTGRSGIRRALLSAETAVTFVLVVGAALFVQTLWNLSAKDRGFDADRLLTVRVSPGLPPEIDRRAFRAGSTFYAQFFSDLRNRLERIPGVASAAAVSLGPLDGFSSGFGNIAVDGRTIPSDSLIPVAFVTPGYFRTMRIPVIGGRDFNDGDRLGAGLVAIVNEAFQRRFAANGNILGARLTSGSGPEAFTVVGLTQDVPDRSLRQAPEPLLIAPLAQMPGVHLSWGALTFVLRSADSDPLRLGPEVRQTIWAINPNIVITEIATMNARVAMALRAERDSALLFGLFALAALVMAAIGVYGVAAYTIVQRTKEIGIRVALGAARQDVWRLVVSQTLWPTLIGIFVGVAAATMLTRLIASMVYGVTPLDVTTFVVGVVVLVSVSLAATWIPARRAIRVDPLVALRYE
jgi:putative ABC transport system permease protein